MTNVESTFPTWDGHIAPRLHRIEELSRQINSRSLAVLELVRGLQSRPDWLTKAEHELNGAEFRLKLALATLQEAKTAYADKPINENPSL